MDFLSGGNKNEQKSSSSQNQPTEDYVDKGTSSFYSHSFGAPKSSYSSTSRSSRSQSASRPRHSSYRPWAKSLASPCPSSVVVSSGKSGSSSSRASSASAGRRSQSSTRSSVSSLISFPPLEQVHDSISIPSTPCAEKYPQSAQVIGPSDPLPIETPDSKPTFSFVAPKAFDAAAKKSGHEVDRNTSEKITDAGREAYEKTTGTEVSDKISN